MKDKSDQQLWTEIRSGDQSSFTSLFDRYHATLYNYGCKLSSNQALVEDAVQDVFIDIWRMRSNLTEQITSVKFYLYRSLRRRIHVSNSRYPFMLELTGLSDWEIPAQDSPHESLLIATEHATGMQRRIRRLLSHLPERQLEAITLRYFDGFSIPEIAEIMGVNEKSVRNFIYKALTSLRQQKQALLPALFLLLFFLFL